MPGPLPKPAHRRQRNNTPGMGELVALPGRKVDPPRPGVWVDSVKADWTALWESPLAVAYLPATDLPALRRLFELRNDRVRYSRAFRKTPMIEGSQGQPKLSPLAATIAGIDIDILHLEDRFGLNPSARLKLGLVLGEAKRSLGLDDDDEDGDDDDLFEGL